MLGGSERDAEFSVTTELTARAWSTSIRYFAGNWKDLASGVLVVDATTGNVRVTRSTESQVAKAESDSPAVPATYAKLPSAEKATSVAEVAIGTEAQRVHGGVDVHVARCRSG